MMISQKHVFWQAFLVAVFIFIVGFLLGLWMESSRIDEVESLYKESEIRFSDVRAFSEASGLSEMDCDLVEKNIVSFADRIYEDAKKIQELEASLRLEDNALESEYKKYSLLRTFLWINSIQASQKCNTSYENVVYLYKYNDEDWDTKAEQNAISRYLHELKKEKSEDIILIPIAGDMNLSSTDLLMENYNVSKLPSVLLSENQKFEGIDEVKNLEEFL